MFKSEDELQSKYGIKEKGDWLNLKEGSNKVRIVSHFVDYGIHSIKGERKYKSVICIGKENNCPYCAKGIKVKVQFLGWVIDRADGKIKLLKIGWTIKEKLRKLQHSEDYGFTNLPDYDIDIIRTGEGLDTNYDVLPARKSTELTEEEKEKILEVVKDPQEIIDKMKEKVLSAAEDLREELPPLKEDNPEEVDLEDIPF
ncbi:MAG: hypothetical protein WC288_01955 [Candidatus Paceibacterota bacterium]|jgi:hypothetical protein